MKSIISGKRSKMAKILTAIILTVLVQISPTQSNTISSYIYLEAKSIKEELAPGSFVLNLAKELESNRQYQTLKSKLPPTATQQYTILEESGKRGGESSSSSSSAYFELDSTTGQITTSRSNTKRLDREFMCANRQCAEACDVATTGGNCRLNLKILLLPSYNIVDLNIFVQDVNDNRPQFRQANFTQQVNENVPVGYKIPIDLAYDPDVGLNSVQRYELINNVDDVFRLEQNLNESQLFLVVQSELDREDKSEYSLVIRAHDGLTDDRSAKTTDDDSKSTLHLNIQLVDINDNNPVFERDLYKFVVSEDAPLDYEIGRVRASDLDSGLNGQIRYSFAETNALNNKASAQSSSHHSSSSSTQTSYFILNETTGSIRLKSPLDFEKDSSFSLTVEARDCGVGSLPAYTQLEITVLDVNDNPPEITVSFLSTLNKSLSTRDGVKYDVFLPENPKPGKFLAHVSIVDRDSGENGRFEWEVWVNGERLTTEDISSSPSSKILKLVKLNENSFTLNVGDAAKHFDRETNEHFDVSVIAWDFGEPKMSRSVYNFSIRLLDLNDNAPRFDKTVYDFYVHENNEPFQIIARVKAHDADIDAQNSNLTYSIKEKSMLDVFQIDATTGSISSAIKFDRESTDKYTFHVVASDSAAGPQSLHSTAMINVHIKDTNDNYPIISFNSTHYHRFHQISNRISSAYFRLGESLSPGSRLIDFKASDRDLSSRFEFSVDSSTATSVFRLTPNGQLFLASRRLDKKRQSIHELNIVCKDSPGPDALNSTIKLTIEVVEQIENCIRGPDSKRRSSHSANSWEETIAMATSTQTTSGEQQQQQPQNQQITPIYINRDRLGRKTIQNRQPLFNVDYSIERHYTKRSSSNTGTQLNRLSIEQLTHIELIESSLFPVEPSSNESSNKNHEVYKLELTLRDDITTNGTANGTTPKLMLGKYTIRIAVSDRLNPTCTPRQDLFHVYVGNDLIDQDELIELLKSIRHRNSSAPSTFDSVSSMKKTNNEANSDNNDDYDPKVIKFSSNDYLFFGGPKPAKGRSIHRYFNGDFVLLFVLILIVVVITLFLTFVSIVCLYGRYKKQYKLSGKKPKTPFSSSPSDSDGMINGKKKSPLATDEEDESVNFTGGSSRLKSSVKKKFLNTSTSSSEANSDELAMDKPQYTRVHGSTSSTRSNGTLQVYRDEEDYVGVITSCNGTIRQYQPMSKTLNSKYLPHHIHVSNAPSKQQQQQQQQRFYYQTIATGKSGTNQAPSISGYETNRSNSGGGESTTVETTTTIDECCSKLSNNSSSSPTASSASSSSSNPIDVVIETTISRKKNSSSSAYSSINVSDSDHSNRMANLEPFEDALKRTLDSGLLSFKKHHHQQQQQQQPLLLTTKKQLTAAPILTNRRGEPTAINANLIKSFNVSNNNSNNSQHQNQSINVNYQQATRTSYNL